MLDSDSVVCDWATMRPDPSSDHCLSLVDRSKLNGHQLVGLMQAQARMVAHFQAELLATMVEVGYCPAGDASSPAERTEEFEEFAADEIRAALCLTRRAADADLDLAWQVCERLPGVWEALHCGAIDMRRARVIVNGVGHLPQEAARAVVDQVIGDSGGLTTGQLAPRLRKLCIQVDPDDARHRYQEGVAERRVIVEPNPDGTADLIGISLPPHRVAAIRRKVNWLARSLKNPSDPRSMDQIRADVFLDLLQGRTSSSSKTGSRGTVEIQVDLKTLAGLSQNPGTIPGWGPVISDIALQIAGKPDHQWQITVTDPDSVQPLWAGVTRRRPDTTQQRLVQAQNPSCVFPGCRMPAVDCDLDHTTAWAQGGPTRVDNLAPLCRHDHRVKHEAGWRLKKTGPNQHTWTSPLGHTYTTTGRSP
jgi:hypothetical protein